MSVNPDITHCEGYVIMTMNWYFDLHCLLITGDSKDCEQ